MALDELKADIQELEALLAVAVRPSVQRLLKTELSSAQQKLQQQEQKQATSSQAPEAILQPKPVAAPVSQTSASITYITPTYGWEQDNTHVTVLVYDLPGVGSIKDRVTCTFHSEGPAGDGKPSFDLIIPDLQGKHYRLKILSLEKDIKVGECSYKVKKSSVEIKLRKAGQWDHWMELKSKAGTIGAGGSNKKKGEEADPSTAIMDMMRDMYQNGDENMRKVIGEAWTKSREDQLKGGKAGGNTGGFGSDSYGSDFGKGLDEELDNLDM